MTNKAHSTLTGSDLHEPKGIGSATSGQVYISNGSGSGTWTDTGSTIGSSNFTTGDLKPTWKTTADSGWIMCDDGTIGDVSSGATTLAASTTSALYTLIWTNFANTEAAVTTGRGASAAADYAAHKAIALPKMLGRVYGIAGAGSGLTSRTMGVTAGAETTTLTQANLPLYNLTVTDTHSHVVSGIAFNSTDAAPSNFGGVGISGTSAVVTSGTSSGGITVSSAGSGTGHTIVQPTVFLKMMVKL